MKKILYSFLSLVLVFTMALLSACGNNDEISSDTNEHTHSYVDGVCNCGQLDPNYVPSHVHTFTDGFCECGDRDPEYKIVNNVVFNGFETVEDEVIEQHYLLKVSNLYDEFDGSELICVQDDVTWMLFKDIECTQLVDVKTIELEYGNNNFYMLLEQDGFESELISVVIYRKAQCIVTFDNGIVYFVDEGDIIEPPVGEKEGFEFVKWDYDFSKPITEDTFVKAIYENKSIYIYFVDNNGNVLAETIEAKYGDVIKLPKPNSTEINIEKWEFADESFEFDDEFEVPYFDVYFHPFEDQENPET